MIAATLTLSALLAACGQKGPLFMPVPLPPPAAKTTTPAPKPNVSEEKSKESDQATTFTVPAAPEIPPKTLDTPATK
ncbi:prokaryotic lipo-attachment site family protein [Collimonas arenae]|uniref:Prokaryotic lipo-attachment site family protein n=1 Tax=Collimonas arenae TaxID=279058 RepID=A0A127PKP8_9BURK|nr:prokaryotic lipo-attachment site family protein [Collimonas arenae]AMP08180.1 prokaryotic lipo-attachment site family protein [Collimonas arenae]